MEIYIYTGSVKYVQKKRDESEGANKNYERSAFTCIIKPREVLEKNHA